MKKCIWFSVFLISSVINATEIESGDCIKTLFLNRDMLIKIYSDCEPDTLRKRFIIPCGGKTSNSIFDTLISNKKLTLKDWYFNGKNIIDFYINFYRNYYKYENSKYLLATNGKIIKLAISFLGDTTNIADYAIRKSALLLSNNTSYPHLKKYEEEIRKYKNNKNINSKEYIDLLVLTTTDKYIADSLLLNKDIPLHYRARLGDTIAEDSLINIFSEENVFRSKVILIDQLIFVGSKKCLKSLIENFNEPVYGYCFNRKVENTIKAPILNGFYKLFPDIPIICEEYSKFKKFQSNPADTIIVKDYIHNFLQWASVYLNAKPKKEADIYILGDECKRF